MLENHAWSDSVNSFKMDTSLKWTHPFLWRGTGGGNPEVMRAGRVREAGEERAGDGIPKGTGVGRNRK